jgi:methylenetetrahydrofolate reductase (NADPH)
MSGAATGFQFEFFPPATPEGATKLSATRAQLAQLGPKFFGDLRRRRSTRDRTLAAVLDPGERAARRRTFHASVRPGHVRATLATYREHGIGHLVTLRGDSAVRQRRRR